MVAILIAVGVSTWVYGIAAPAFDYDEWVHAYESWLVQQRPQAVPRLLRVPSSVRLVPAEPVFLGLRRLLQPRCISSASSRRSATWCFFVAMLKNVALSLRELPNARALAPAAGRAGGRLIALQPRSSTTWSSFASTRGRTRCLMIAIYRYRTRRTNALRSSIELAALSAAAILCSPKLVCSSACSGWPASPPTTGGCCAPAGMLAGGVGMLALGAGFLRLAGHNPVHVYRLALGYHRVLNAKGGFGHGNFEIVWDQTVHPERRDRLGDRLAAGGVASNSPRRVRDRDAAVPGAPAQARALRLQAVLLGPGSCGHRVPALPRGAGAADEAAALGSARGRRCCTASATPADRLRRLSENASFVAADIAGRKEMEALVPPRPLRDGLDRDAAVVSP